MAQSLVEGQLIELKNDNKCHGVNLLMVEMTMESNSLLPRGKKMSSILDIIYLGEGEASDHIMYNMWSAVPYEMLRCCSSSRSVS